MLLCAWRRSGLAKNATLSGNTMIQFVSHGPTGGLISVVFGAVPRRRIAR